MERFQLYIASQANARCASSTAIVRAVTIDWMKDEPVNLPEKIDKNRVHRYISTQLL